MADKRSLVASCKAGAGWIVKWHSFRWPLDAQLPLHHSRAVGKMEGSCAP